MPPTIIDPRRRQALQEDREASGALSASQVAGVAPTPPASLPVASPAILPGGVLAPAFRDKVHEDFRLFLIILWRHLLNGQEPQELQLDMAGWLQHGPERSLSMLQRGAGKSWVTGGYGLWRLDRNPQTENLLVVSGSQKRARSSTNWMLQLIREWEFLHHLAPKPSQRQSTEMFDVGPAKAQQSASVMSLGIGGQATGFRADCIIPDDVETQTNSVTADMREKIENATLEFDSLLKPDTAEHKSAIKYLGTPHDAESLYNRLPKRGFPARIWPAIYPDAEQRKVYGDRLAPYIVRKLAKDPSLVGTPTMPGRFSAADLERRKLSIGASEFALQFNLDTSLSDKNKYPLKARDLMVMSVDPRLGPESVAWTNDAEFRLRGLPILGFEGDFYHAPRIPEGVPMLPWRRRIGAVDTSGRGSDEVSLVVGLELNATVFVADLWADTAGFEPATLGTIADRCVRWKLHSLLVEENFGGGMFVALLRPVLAAHWRAYLKTLTGPDKAKLVEELGGQEGTEIVEVKASNKTAKERRILSLLEPATQQHRVVLSRAVVEWDYASLQEKEGSDTRHKYSLMYQFTHLTRDRECLAHDDRLDSLATLISGFGDALGGDPTLMAQANSRDRLEEELEKLYGDLDDDPQTGLPTVPGGGSAHGRAASLRPQNRS